MAHALDTFQPLLTRVDPKQVEAMVEASRETPTVAAPPAAKAKASKAKPAPRVATAATIEFDDFAKIDLRIAEIVAADHVEGADKLLRLTLNLGEGADQKQVFAGIKSAYQPEDLVGKTVIVVANLQPAVIRGVESQGMLLAVEDGGKLIVITPEQPAASGKPVA